MANGNQDNRNWLDEFIQNLASIVGQDRGKTLPSQDVQPPKQSASVPQDLQSKLDYLRSVQSQGQTSSVQDRGNVSGSKTQSVSNFGSQSSSSSGTQQPSGFTLTFSGSISDLISNASGGTSSSSGSLPDSKSLGGITGFSGAGSSSTTGGTGTSSTTVKNPFSSGGMSTGGFDGRVSGTNTTKTSGASSNPSDVNRPPSERGVPPSPPPDKPAPGQTSTTQSAGDNAFGGLFGQGGSGGFGGIPTGTTGTTPQLPQTPQPPTQQPSTTPTVPPPSSQPPPSPTSTSGTGTVSRPPSQPPPSPSNTTFTPPPSPTPQTTQGGTTTPPPPSPPPPPPPPATQGEQPVATFDVPVLVMPQVVWDYIGTFAGTPPSLELAADNSAGLPKPFIPRPHVPEAYRNLEVATYYTYPSFFNGRKVDWTLSVGNRSLLPAYYVWPVSIVSFDYPAGVALHHVRETPNQSNKTIYLIRVGLLGWDALSQVSQFSARLSQLAGLNELSAWTGVSSAVAEKEVILLSPFIPGGFAATAAYAGTETQEAPFTFFVRAYDSQTRRFIALNSNPLTLKMGETIPASVIGGVPQVQLPGFPDPDGLFKYVAGFYYPVYLGVTLALRDDIVQADTSKNLSNKMAKWLAGMPCVFAIVQADVTDWSFRATNAWYANVPMSPYSELISEQTVVKQATSQGGVRHTFKIHARIETAKVELGLALMVPLFAAWVNPLSAKAPISKMAKEWAFGTDGKQSLGCFMSFGTLVYNRMRDGSVRFGSLAISSDDQVIKDMGISNLSIKFSRDTGILNEVPRYDANDPDFVYIGQTIHSYMLLPPDTGAKHTIVKVTPDMFQKRTGLLTHTDGVAAMRPIKSLNAYLIYLAAPNGKSITSPVQFKSNETDEKTYGVVKCNISAMTRPGDIVPGISLNVRNLACFQSKSSFKKHWPVTFYGSKIDFTKALVGGKLSASKLIEAWNPPQPSNDTRIMISEAALPTPERPGNVPSPFGAVDVAFDKTSPYYWLSLLIWPEDGGHLPNGGLVTYDYLLDRRFHKGTPPNTSNRLLTFQNPVQPEDKTTLGTGYISQTFGAISYGTNEYRWAADDKVEFTYTPLKTDPQKQEWITLSSKTGKDAPLDISRWLVVVIPNPPSRYPSILGTVLPPAKEDVPYCIARYPVISRTAINQLNTNGKSLRQFFGNFRPKDGNAWYRLWWIDTLCRVKMMDEKKVHLGLEMGGAIEEIRELDSRKDNDRTLMTLHNNIVNPQPDSFLSSWHSALWYYSDPSLFAKLPIMFDEVFLGNTSYGEMRYVPVYAYSCANAFPYALQSRSADLITKVIVSESDKRIDTMYLKVISPIAWLGSKVFIPAVLVDGFSVDNTQSSGTGSGTGGTGSGGGGMRW